MQIPRDGFKVFFAVSKWKNDKIDLLRHFSVECGAISAAVDDPPSMSVGVDRTQDFRQFARLASVENAVGRPSGHQNKRCGSCGRPFQPGEDYVLHRNAPASGLCSAYGFFVYSS